MEERLLRSGHELFRQMLEKGAQLKADPAPPICPVCQNKLSRWKPGHGTSIQTRFGTICIQRARGRLQTVPRVAFFRRRAVGTARGSQAIAGGAGNGGTDGRQDARARSPASGGTFGGGDDFSGDSRANEVLLVADGAAWIWNLAGNRFAGARQHVDYYSISHLHWQYRG